MERLWSVTIKGAILCALIAGCSRGGVPEFDYEELNAQAAQEYLHPVHPTSSDSEIIFFTCSITSKSFSVKESALADDAILQFSSTISMEFIPERTQVTSF